MNTPDTENLPAAPRAVLADDERLMREQLRARLSEVWPELQIVGEARNGLEAVQMVDEHRPEVVFLDIRMPGLTGVEAARQITQLPPRTANDGTGGDEDGDEDEDELLPEIVFITAYDQYAVEAFEQGVADYVLKPAERERLLVTVQRIQQRLAARNAPAGSVDAPRRPTCSSCCTSSAPGSTPAARPATCSGYRPPWARPYR